MALFRAVFGYLLHGVDYNTPNQDTDSHGGNLNMVPPNRV
jgi:hypothetical protein